ncbi:hypothetical protein PRIPAC_73133 [Pristionchus pacificus]|nr:hypothetical protein PRIPAC_73133 [Pristionchus pacificus]
MSYVLYSSNSTFDLTDRQAVKGFSIPGYEIEVKKDGEMIKGVFLDEGTLKKMTAEKQKYVNGEKTIPKQSKRPLFKVVDAPDSDDELGLEEEQSLLDALRKLPFRNARNVKMEKMSPEPEKKRRRGNSLPPAAIVPPPSTGIPSLPQTTVPRVPIRVTKKTHAVPSVLLPSSATVVSSTPNTVTLEMIFDKLNDVQTTLSLISSRQDRLERRVGEITNDSVGIRHQTRTLVESTEKIEENVANLATVVNEVKDRLPRPPTGPQYDLYGLTEEEVATIIILSPSFLLCMCPLPTRETPRFIKYLKLTDRSEAGSNPVEVLASLRMHI